MPTNKENTITPEAMAIIENKYPSKDYKGRGCPVSKSRQEAVIFGLTNPELLEAQGLHTTKELEEAKSLMLNGSTADEKDPLFGGLERIAYHLEKGQYSASAKQIRLEVLILKKKLEEAKGRGGTHRWVKCFSEPAHGKKYSWIVTDYNGHSFPVKFDQIEWYEKTIVVNEGDFSRDFPLGSASYLEEIPSTEKLFTEEEYLAYGKECAGKAWTDGSNYATEDISQKTDVRHVVNPGFHERLRFYKSNFLKSLSGATKKEDQPSTMLQFNDDITVAPISGIEEKKENVDGWISVEDRLPTSQDSDDDRLNEVETLQIGRSTVTLMKYWEIKNCPFTRFWKPITPFPPKPWYKP